MSYQCWMRCAVLSSALVALPLQSALASGAQWRQGKSLSPAGQHPMVRMQRSDLHARFRPVDQRSRQTLQASQRYVAPAAPVQPPRPPQIQAPAFARQFAWRPAPSPWSPHGAMVQQAQYQPRNVPAQQRFAGVGQWRPVPGAFVPAGSATQQPRMAPQFVRSSESAAGWRPSSGPEMQQPVSAGRQFVYRPVEEQQTVVAQQRPRAPRAPRFPAYVQPRMPSPHMAGYYMPVAPPAYPAMAHYPVAQRPWQPYVAAPAMMMPPPMPMPMPMPPQPMWGWAGPAYGYGAPAAPQYGWQAQPVANDPYLAGCPDC